MAGARKTNTGHNAAMPDWLATVLGAFVGGFAALAGVWLQIRAQRSAEEARLRAEREADAARERDERARTFGVALAVLDQYAPQRIIRSVPMARSTLLVTS